MVLIAALLYLPEHIATMASRAWFYYTGDEAAAAAAAAAAVAGSVNAGGGGGGNVEGISKGTGDGGILRRVDAIGRGKGDVDGRRGEGGRMPGEEVLELLGRL